MIHQEGTLESAGGQELYTQSWYPESGAKAIIAIIHGIGEHSGRYANVVNHLVPKGFIVYGCDLRGHGRSPGKRGHIEKWQVFREDVDSFLKMIRLENPDLPLFLMGHSLGGLIVLEYGLHHPDDLEGLIASGPALEQSGVSPFLITLSRLLSPILPGITMHTGLDAKAISRDPGVIASYQQDPLVHDLASIRLGAEMGTAMEFTRTHAAEWKIPLLILHGGADQLVPPRASQDFFDSVLLGNKKRIEYAGGFHEPHNDINHEQVTADLEHWLVETLSNAQET